jgi:SAM-dependent methyltransferase
MRKVNSKAILPSRDEWFDLAGQYLPKSEDSLIVDLGCGAGHFAERLDLAKRFKRLTLLDGNHETVRVLKHTYANVVEYKAPERMPFDNESVDFIHCSHMVEHLYHQELFQTILELDRVLKRNGVLVISAPLYWREFYNDLSHVRPYPPIVFTKYLCEEPSRRSSLTRPLLSNRYKALECRYRTITVPLFAHMSIASDFVAIDKMIRGIKKIVKILRVNRTERNGYTLVLEKTG